MAYNAQGPQAKISVAASSNYHLSVKEKAQKTNCLATHPPPGNLYFYSSKFFFSFFLDSIYNLQETAHVRLWVASCSDCKYDFVCFWSQSSAATLLTPAKKKINNIGIFLKVSWMNGDNYYNNIDISKDFSHAAN